MMDMLIADLDKEMQEMEVEEKDSQKEYEQSIEEKESAKADLEAKVQSMTLEHKDKLKELYAVDTTIKDLHLECDWLISNFDARKEARAGEVDSLKKAKAVLSGADYSL